MDAADVAVSLTRGARESVPVTNRPRRKRQEPAQPAALGTKAPARLVFNSDEERLASFQQSLDAVRERVEASLGSEDVAHIDRIRRLSLGLEIAGRALIHVSLDPVTFGVGVAGLSAHKALELMEIGHMALHGVYDKLPGAERFNSKTFYWRAPIDEQGWHAGHNVRHHQYTNIAGRDPDLDFGGMRLSARLRHKLIHRLQPLTNVLSWTAFANAINLHVTGLLDLYLDKSDPPVLKDHSFASIREAHAKFLRKYIRYHAREYVFFPVLAGPFFLKTLLGNILSEMGRDLYAGAIIYSGHVGARDFPADARAGSRAAWYAMQVEAACNTDLPHALSILAGALDKQIEHHLFPRLPPNRLREIAPEVKAICEAHGVRYVSGTFGERLKVVFRTLRELSVQQVA
jgi:NADPH-dependent stearoyl-CoA 9-desaturase